MEFENIDALKQYIFDNWPEYTLVKIDDYETEDHLSFKYLHDKEKIEISNLREEAISLSYKCQELEKENSHFIEQINALKKANERFLNQTKSFTEFVDLFIDKEIIVSNVTATTPDGKTIETGSESDLGFEPALEPGVYGFRRASWFSEIDREFEKNNYSKEMVGNTISALSDKVSFWDKMKLKISQKKITKDAAAEEIDLNRTKLVKKLLSEQISNEEKYIKYMLLTPGLGMEYVKTLNGASELGIDANIVIKLLEQPKESFNKEIVQIYVSELRKANEFNLKKELAVELIKNEWCIVSDINGQPQKFQLLPYDIILELKNDLKTIATTLLELKGSVNGDGVVVPSSFSENSLEYDPLEDEDGFMSLSEMGMNAPEVIETMSDEMLGEF